MAKKRVKDAARDLLADFLEEHALELFHIEFVKEGRERYLRIYIDKPEKAENMSPSRTVRWSAGI